MANAMEILGDKNIIYSVYYHKYLKFYYTDDPEAIFLKEYINNAIDEVIAHTEKYELEWEEYLKRKAPYPKYYWYGKGLDHINLKVNHYRQKLMYWKKLKQ